MRSLEGWAHDGPGPPGRLHLCEDGASPVLGTQGPPSFQLIFQILPEATLHQLLPESRF
jgi:hypothetical protein